MLRIVSESVINGETIVNAFDVSTGVVATVASLVAAFYILFYVLRSIGIYKLAKGQGVDNAFLAWIPCVWIFTACKIIGKARFFSTTAEKAALWICIIFSCAAIIPFAYNFLLNFPYIMYYLQGGDISIISSSGLYIQTGTDFINHFDTPAINAILKILVVFNYILRIAEIFITVTVYIALFRKFLPEHYILAAVLSFFGFFGVMVFAIRNRKAVDFDEYIRRRYYGGGFTPYGNRYYGNQNGQNRPYGGGQSGYYGTADGKDEPFDEFDNRPEEPFGEFSGDNGDKRGKGSNDDKDDFFQ